MRYEYKYTDLDGDRLIIEAPGWPANTASVSVHGNAVFVPADEAPKAAQAILDAAGVQGAVLTGELPKVSIDHRGRYRTESNIRWTQIDSDNPYCDINEHIRGLLAIKLKMEADAKTDRVAEIVRGKTEAEARKKYEEIRKAHDDLRTSPIALKALALYNKGCIRPSYPYKTWDATNEGYGSSDEQVHYYIGQVEAKEKEATEKLAARRDELAKELCDGTSIGPWYEAMGTVHKRAIDRIIELESQQNV